MGSKLTSSKSSRTVLQPQLHPHWCRGRPPPSLPFIFCPTPPSCRSPLTRLIDGLTFTHHSISHDGTATAICEDSSVGPHTFLLRHAFRRAHRLGFDIPALSTSLTLHWTFPWMTAVGTNHGPPSMRSEGSNASFLLPSSSA